MEKIASICHRKLNALLPRWVVRTAPGAGALATGHDRPASRVVPDAANPFTPAASSPSPARAPRRNRGESASARGGKPPRPLRVLQIIDPIAPAPGLGRIVISGRMADVCAELDRLAALEARRSCTG